MIKNVHCTFRGRKITAVTADGAASVCTRDAERKYATPSHYATLLGLVNTKCTCGYKQKCTLYSIADGNPGKT